MGDCLPVVSPHHSLDLGVEVAVREADHQTLGSSKGYKLIVVIHFIAAFCGHNDAAI